MTPLSHERIERIEFAQLTGSRPRLAGSNARLGEHGVHVRPTIARLTTTSGASGFGFSQVTQDEAASLVGIRLDALFSLDSGSLAPGLPVDFALWDLVGQLQDQPVYALAAAVNGLEESGPLHAPCYDTSLYIDDLHLQETTEAAALIADEAASGQQRGHTAFKIKVGRGARHMPVEAGTTRDIAIIRAVRDRVGGAATIMLDANNGYNLNLTKRVLAETAACRIHWMEEPFHEDGILYADLKAWLTDHNLETLIADGEGQASPSLLAWSQEGLIDVVQYDIFGYGFTPWLALGRKLDMWGVRSGPHHYGRFLGNFVACHLMSAIGGFAFVEWDEAASAAVDTSAYAIRDGLVSVPSLPGFGLFLDEAEFRKAVAETGFMVRLDG